MNKRQRVTNAMNLKAVDRPPVGFWFHFPEDQCLGQVCVDAHLDYYNNIDVDMAKLMCDGYFDYPNPVAKAVVNPEDWMQMKPLGPDSDFIRGQVERAKAVRTGLRDDMIVLYNVFAPFSTLRFGTSDAVVTRHLNENPDAILYALNVVAQDNALLCEKLITEGGVDGVYYCLQGAEENRMNHDDYMRLIAPSDLKVLTYANRFSDMNMLHCCGWAGIPNRLENWREYPAKSVNWACFIENMQVKEGQEFFGGRCVLGGFDNRREGVLFSGTRAEVEVYTRALVASAPATGFMIGADCTLPLDIDPERFQWVVDCVKTLAT